MPELAVDNTSSLDHAARVIRIALRFILSEPRTPKFKLDLDVR
jgi:hypothetical protein